MPKPFSTLDYTLSKFLNVINATESFTINGSFNATFIELIGNNQNIILPANIPLNQWPIGSISYLINADGNTKTIIPEINVLINGSNTPIELSTNTFHQVQLIRITNNEWLFIDAETGAGTENNLTVGQFNPKFPVNGYDQGISIGTLVPDSIDFSQGTREIYSISYVVNTNLLVIQVIDNVDDNGGWTSVLINDVTVDRATMAYSFIVGAFNRRSWEIVNPMNPFPVVGATVPVIWTI